jgi:hypothetical protein
MPIGVALRSHSFERVDVQDIYNHVVSIVVYSILWYLSS